MTWKRQYAIFPDGSVNTYSMSVLPSIKVSPGERFTLVETWPPELSLTVGEGQVTTAVFDPWSATSNTPCIGQFITVGGVVSITPSSVDAQNQTQQNGTLASTLLYKIHLYSISCKMQHVKQQIHMVIAMYM